MKNNVVMTILAGALALTAIGPSAMAATNRAHPAQPNAISPHTFTKVKGSIKTSKASNQSNPAQPRAIGGRPFTR